jgi:FkbM family methyltransferase
VKKIKKIIKHILNQVLYFLLLKKNPNFFFKKISGVIHIGANTGQERKEYEKYSLAVIWVEPIPEVFEELKKNIISYPNQKAFKYLLTDVDDQEIELKIANNNGLSSSIFNFGLHTHIWPNINYVKSIQLKSSTLTSLVKSEKIDLQKYQALVIDTQGSELLILKGASEILKKFNYIVAEAADFESYVGCCLLKDLSNFLNGFGFKEVVRTKFAHHSKAGNYYDVVYEKIF